MKGSDYGFALALSDATELYQALPRDTGSAIAALQSLLGLFFAQAEAQRPGAGAALLEHMRDWINVAEAPDLIRGMARDIRKLPQFQQKGLDHD